MSLPAPVEKHLHAEKNLYAQVFGSPLGQEILADLAQFCRAAESTFHADPRVHALLEGRREVFLRIANRLNLTTEQLYSIITHNKTIQLGEANA